MVTCQGSIRRRPTAAAAVGALAALGGCASPHIAIISPTVAATPAEDAAPDLPPGLGITLKAFDTQPPPLKEHEVLFRLRTSHIVVAGAGKTPTNGATSEAANVCPTAAAGGPPITPPDCLATASVTSTSAASGTYYIAAPKDGVPWVHTSLTTTTSGDDPSNIIALNVSTTDNSTKVLSGAAAGATGGAAFGPWGLAIGGLIGGAAAMRAAGTDPTPITPFLCQADQSATFNPPSSLRLDLPVSIDTTPDPIPVINPLGSEAIPIKTALTRAKAACFHRLPVVNPKPGVEADSGWLYRISVVRRPVVTDLDAFLATPAAPKRFPYNACELAEVDLVWWRTIAGNRAGHANDWRTYSDVVPDRSYFVQVAVRGDLQSVALPKSGSIKLGAVCGATVQATPYAGSSAADELSALASFAESIEKLEAPKSK